jgi:leucyl-tRNA synthetase
MRCFSGSKVPIGIAVFVLLVSGSLIGAAQNTDSTRITKLFTDIKEHSRLAEEDAQLLESYTRGNISWQSHTRRLTAMREHVDELLKDYNEAQSLREEGSPWQQEAIDQLRPLLQGMAGHLTATIQHQNQNQTQVHMQAWIDYVHGNSEYATRAASLIHDLVDYGAAKSNAESLEMKLKMPGD